MTGPSSHNSTNKSICWHRLLAVVIAFSSVTIAHSWNEQLSVIGPGGKYISNGYPRGYVARTDPGFNGESMKYILPSLESGRTRINPSDLLCHPSQRTSTQPPQYPRLKVASGSAIAMKYLENGHVSLPQNQPGKPPKGGTVFVFGTTQPKSDEKISDVLQWTRDGSGGDKRGVLIAANNYDDERCHQINGGAISTQRQQEFPDPTPGQAGSHNELWCETDVVLPNNLPVGKTYTVYWIWQWPTLPGRDPGIPHGKDEYYTTCSDLDVVAQVMAAPSSNRLTQQDPMMHAPADYMNRAAITQDQIPGQKPAASAVSSPAGGKGPQHLHLHAPPKALAPAPAPVDAGNGGNVMTALVTVTAVMPPGQSIFVVEGKHRVVFQAPQPTQPPLARRAFGNGKSRIETHDDPYEFDDSKR